MTNSKQLLGLDVGDARIGVAFADTDVRIAIPYDYIEADGNEIAAIAELVIRNSTSIVVIGYPRNQSGEATRQTESVERFAKKLQDLDADIVFQDESLTSVMAEQRLASRRKSYSKGDIDSEAAAIILQDYMEQNI
jgi:putative holliday junction resolvase